MISGCFFQISVQIFEDTGTCFLMNYTAHSSQSTSTNENELQKLPCTSYNLQSVLNAAARLIFHLRRSDRISDALVCLHWLRVPERIEFKIAVLTYRVLCGAAPRYLGPLNRTADMADRRPLRSSATNRLVVPPYRLSSVGSRAFPVAAAKIRNALPDNLVSATSLQTFRRHLKTFLFQRSFS